MSDLIRREDAFSKFEKACTCDSVDKNGMKRGEIKTALTWEGIRKILENIPSAEPDNQVHLCDSCHYSYPVCPAMNNDVIFGNGIGHDNICACAKFEIKPEQTVKVYHKQAPDKLYYFYCGACGEIIDCSFHEDYKSIKSYCGYCGAKLDWSRNERLYR